MAVLLVGFFLFLKLRRNCMEQAKQYFLDSIKKHVPRETNLQSRTVRPQAQWVKTRKNHEVGLRVI